jgi:hypothetical protein
MAIKFTDGEGMDTVTTENGFVFDRYFSIVNEDAFNAYSSFIYLVVKRLNGPQSILIRRNAYLVPFALLDEFFKIGKSGRREDRAHRTACYGNGEFHKRRIKEGSRVNTGPTLSKSRALRCTVPV